MGDAPPEEQVAGVNAQTGQSWDLSGNCSIFRRRESLRRRNRQCLRCLSFMEGRVSSSLDNTGWLVTGSEYGMVGVGREES